MPIEYSRLERRSRLEERHVDALTEVDALAQRLKAELDVRSADIDAAHIHGASSAAVQAIVSTILKDALGFEEEYVLPLDNGLVSRPRPDFFYELRGGGGVIAEVERGGTVTNNHDLKDIWKAHISSTVEHLFLVVPNSNWTASGGPRERPYVRVQHRMGAFFGDDRREIDVVSCHVFGYGRLT